MHRHLDHLFKHKQIRVLNTLATTMGCWPRTKGKKKKKKKRNRRRPTKSREGEERRRRKRQHVSRQPLPPDDSGLQSWGHGRLFWLRAGHFASVRVMSLVRYLATLRKSSMWKKGRIHTRWSFNNAMSHVHKSGCHTKGAARKRAEDLACYQSRPFLSQGLTSRIGRIKIRSLRVPR